MDHVYAGSSCIFCGCDDHDVSADYPCPVERAPVSYSLDSSGVHGTPELMSALDHLHGSQDADLLF